MFFLLISFFQLFPFSFVFAQTSPLYLTWDYSVGCQDSTNPDHHKSYLELMQSNDCMRVCQGSEVAYSIEQSNANWQDVTWNVTGGVVTANAGEPFCVVKWSRNNTTNVGSIGATITTANGVLTLAPLCIDIVRKPKAQFDRAPFSNVYFEMIDPKSNMQACTAEEINFADGSLDNGGTAITNRHWDFGDGITSNETYPTHSYAEQGEYKITLTVSNACNCQSEYSRDIDVGKKGVAISCPGAVCEGQLATYHVIEDFERAPIEPICGEWTINGGRILSSTHGDTVVVDWTESNKASLSSSNDGFGYITFNPVGCTTDCYEPTTLKIPIIKNRMPITGDAIICGSGQQRYSMPQWPTTDFNWEVVNNGTQANFILSDQRNEIILNPGTVAGTIILRGVYQNTLLNCGGLMQEKTIVIKSDAVITGNTATCVDATEVYTTEGGLSCNWKLKKLPNGPEINSQGETFTTTFTTAGDYNLTVFSASYCSSSPVIIHVKNTPTPLLSDVVHNLPYVCPSTPSVFSITNTIPNTIIGWEVPANIGAIVGPSYGDDVQVVFYSPLPANAAYLIKVWRESTSVPLCKSALLTVPLEIRPMVLTIDGVHEPCGSTYQEYDVPETHGDLYEWSISPPDKGSIVSVLEGGRRVRVLWNQYSVATPASLKLKVTECGITRVVTPFPIRIITSPILSILPNAPSICRGDRLTFTVNGIPDLSAYDSITWNFGDGSDPEPGPTVSHPFTAISDQVATYTVTVTVVNPNRCNNTTTQTTQVTVQVAPVASISPAGSYIYCTGETVNLALTATAQSGFGATTEVVWYKNGVALAPLTGINNNYTITTPGSYYAQVSNGTCQTQTNTVTVAVETCIADCTANNHLTLNTTTSCGAVAATATYDGTPTIEWMGVGLQPNATPTQASYVFNQAGDFIIGYTATYTNASGQTCKATKQTAVQVPYIADLKYSISCGTTSGTYTVQLLDHSNYNTQTPINNWEFKVGTTIMPRLAGDLVNNRTLTMTPGTYTVRLTITGANQAPCYKEVTLVLPDMPIATFTVAHLFCQGEVTHFSTPTQANVTYYWDFDDESYNTQANPDREYQYGFWKPILTVKNQYGCTVSSLPDTNNPVIVNRNDQKVRIETPTFACPGGGTTLNYTPVPSTFPATSCQWLYNNQPIAGATSNPFTLQGAALQSGSYSVIVGNQFGCKKQMAQSVPVAVVKPAIRSINGPSVVCYGQEVTFSVLSGSATNLVYHWSLNGIPTPNDVNFILGSYELGNHTISLTIDTPTADGGICSNSLSHSFTVVSSPNPPVCTFEMLCNPFRVRILAYNEEEGGLYNWSNGMVGNDIKVDHGGIYQVTYTNVYGCTSSSTITIPKNPETYMWVFPYGCYTFCPKLDSTLIGPALATFANWQWQTDDSTTGHSPGEVISEVLDNVLYTTDSNTYNLVLQNDPNPDCKIKSKNMSATVVDCVQCQISMEIANNTVVNHITEPFEHYLFTLHISNTTLSILRVIVSTSNAIGVITSGLVLVPMGGHSYTFDFIPNENYIPNENITVYASSYTFDSGVPWHCNGIIDINPGTSNAGIHRLSLENSANSLLEIVPNPVKNKVSFRYDYSISIANGDPRMSIYDLLGRELDHFVPTESKSSWSLDMSGYQAGHYIVVMRLHGVLVQQQKMVVTH